jgi:hypothetical protein
MAMLKFYEIDQQVMLLSLATAISSKARYEGA